MNSVSIFSFDSYRSFLSALLKARGFTYRSFCLKYGQIVSLNALAKTLSKGRGGARETLQYRMSAETLAKLGKTIGLTDNEITYLCLLRYENDCENLKGLHGQTLKRLLRKLVNDYKSSFGSKEIISLDQNLGKTGILVGKILEKLPNPHKKRVIFGLFEETRIYLGRQPNKLDVHETRKLLAELDQLL